MKKLFIVISYAIFFIIGSIINNIIDFWLFSGMWYVIAILFALPVINVFLEDAEISTAKKTTSEKTTVNSPLIKSVNNDLRIMNDCLKFINTSSNLNTVINRYEDLLVVLTRLTEYEINPNIRFEGELPSCTIKRVLSEKNTIMNNAVKRAYDDMLIKCTELKTEKGRRNRQIRFFEEVKAFMDLFPPETQNFVNNIINESTKNTKNIENINNPSVKSQKLSNIKNTKNIDNSLKELKEILDSDSATLFSIENEARGAENSDF